MIEGATLILLVCAQQQSGHAFGRFANQGEEVFRGREIRRGIREGRGGEEGAGGRVRVRGGVLLLSYLIAIRFPKFPFRNNNEGIERNNNEKCDSTGKFTRAMRAT